MTSRPAAGSNEVDKNHFQEHEFAVDVDLRATPHQVTIIQLEPPESSLNPLSDTGIPGVDVIPYVFDETARRTFTVENKQGAAHTLLFLNANDEVLLRVSSETPTVTQVIPAGRYKRGRSRQRPKASGRGVIARNSSTDLRYGRMDSRS